MGSQASMLYIGSKTLVSVDYDEREGKKKRGGERETNRETERETDRTGEYKHKTAKTSIGQHIVLKIFFYIAPRK